MWATESPPTLRSCVLYSNGEPIFCCVQHYLLSMISEHITGFIGRQTPCIMLYHSNDDCMLKHYVKYCEDEYNRLKGEDAYQPIIKNNGEIGRLNEEID